MTTPERRLIPKVFITIAIALALAVLAGVFYSIVEVQSQSSSIVKAQATLAEQQKRSDEIRAELLTQRNDILAAQHTDLCNLAVAAYPKTSMALPYLQNVERTIHCPVTTLSPIP